MTNTTQTLLAVLLVACASPSVSAFSVAGPRASAAFTTSAISRSLPQQYHRNAMLRMVSVDYDTAEEKKTTNDKELTDSHNLTATLEATTTTTTELNAVAPAISTAQEEEEPKQLMQQVKDAGAAGVVSYALWECAFWAVSVPVCVVGYYEVTGHWPDLGNADDQAKLGAEAFAFVNFARFAVPLRIGLALGTTPWIQSNVLDRFFTTTHQDDENVKELEQPTMRSDEDAREGGDYL